MFSFPHTVPEIFVPIQRPAWLDNVKMYAMLWVILGHVMTIVIKTNVDLPGHTIGLILMLL